MDSLINYKLIGNYSLKNISFDCEVFDFHLISGNDYIPCKHFLKAMESKTVYFHNYEKTRCALDVRYNWFMETTIVNIDYLHQQNEVMRYRYRY